jgi:hypothetical protein
LIRFGQGTSQYQAVGSSRQVRQMLDPPRFIAREWVGTRSLVLGVNVSEGLSRTMK